MFGDDPEKEKLIEQLSARAPEEALPRFPEVTGVCRTCSNAHIFRRQYSEVPIVTCTYVRDVRMPLDIIECSDYQKRGGLSLRDMAEMAILVDDRKQGGQYL